MDRRGGKGWEFEREGPEVGTGGVERGGSFEREGPEVGTGGVERGGSLNGRDLKWGPAGWKGVGV